jgi:subtilisin family serine protease
MKSVAITPSYGGIFSLRLVDVSSSPKRVECMLGDDGMSWAGLAQWLAPTENNTVTWPATSDSSIGVAAYASKMSDNIINAFSGRGTRIDGASLVDIAAPGSTVFTIGRNVSYTAFGGTSSAGPHVAGAAALLLQADTSLNHTRVLQLLRSGASSDLLTGAVPNNTWGYGRLRIVNSLKQINTSIERRAVFPSSWAFAQNYPNPFNGTTTITYTLPSRSRVRVEVYNLLGQLVETLVDEEQNGGPGKVLWKGNAASGVYFCRLEAVSVSDYSRRYSGVIKLVLLR